jgi:hypothetical protein
MPEKKTKERAAKAKSPSSKAGEYVREEMDHIREGKHGARNTKQAIAIGLSKARKAGVKIPPSPGKKTSKTTAKKAGSKPSPKRSRATLKALKREGSAAASHAAISKQARSAARKRGPAKRKQAARKAARTRARKAA